MRWLSAATCRFRSRSVRDRMQWSLRPPCAVWGSNRRSACGTPPSGSPLASPTRVPTSRRRPSSVSSPPTVWRWRTRSMGRSRPKRHECGWWPSPRSRRPGRPAGGSATPCWTRSTASTRSCCARCRVEGVWLRDVWTRLVPVATESGRTRGFSPRRSGIRMDLSIETIDTGNRDGGTGVEGNGRRCPPGDGSVGQRRPHQIHVGGVAPALLVGASGSRFALRSTVRALRRSGARRRGGARGGAIVVGSRHRHIGNLPGGSLHGEVCDDLEFIGGRRRHLVVYVGLGDHRIQAGAGSVDRLYILAADLPTGGSQSGFQLAANGGAEELIRLRGKGSGGVALDAVEVGVDVLGVEIGQGQ